jgi:hypothetical protein
MAVGGVPNFFAVFVKHGKPHNREATACDPATSVRYRWLDNWHYIALSLIGVGRGF